MLENSAKLQVMAHKATLHVVEMMMLSLTGNVKQTPTVSQTLQEIRSAYP